MSFISITRLRLRSARFLPAFALHTHGALRQVKSAPGFQGGSLLADRGWAFWTMTAWDSQETMRDYMTTGRHRAAMSKLLDWCDEASVVHWTQPQAALPAWTEADRRMRETGRPSKVRHPSPDQAALSYRAPRLAGAAPIRPAARTGRAASPSP